MDHPADYQPKAPQATARNMRITETMRAYWEQAKLLMEICGEYAPHPIVVHVEPDEWGHMLLADRQGDHGDGLAPVLSTTRD